MKKIFFLILLFSCLKSEAQYRIFGPDFRLTRSHRWGTFGTSTSDTTFYTDSLRVKAFKPILPGVYTTAGRPAAAAFPGYIIVNSDSTNKPQYSDGTNWINLPGTGGGGGGSGTVTSVALAAGTSGTDVNISGSPITTSGTITLNIPDASATARGLMTTGTQTIAGAKTWSGNAVFNGTLQAGGTSNGVINIASSAASVRGAIELSSNNPSLNSATGTWLFRQSGATVGLYNATGFFFGGGTTPSGFVVGILAGTTTNAPLRFNSGPLTTSAVAGNEEFLTDKRYTTITTGAARKEYTLNDIALTAGRIPYTTTNGRLSDNAGVLYDGTNMSLGTTGAKLTLFSLWSSGDATITSDDQVNIVGGLVVSRAVAGDADFTATTAMQTIMLPQISANRALTLPTPANGQIYIIHNENSAGFAWNITGTLQDKTNSAVTSLANDTVYIIQGISNTHWKIVTIY